MPTRLLREGIVNSERMETLTPEAEVLFYRLLVVADDLGLMDARPAVIRSRCFALREELPKARIVAWLQELVTAGMVVCYFADGKPYLAIQRWEQRQRSHAKYPTPDGRTFVDATAIDGDMRAAVSTPPSLVSVPPSSVGEVLTLDGQLHASRARGRDEGRGTRNEERGSRSEGPPDGDLFARFWRAWPQKVAKLDAERAFSKLKVDAIFLETVLLPAIERSKASAKWREGIIPHPATWLNGRRWEDEAERTTFNDAERELVAAFNEILGDRIASVNAPSPKRLACAAWALDYKPIAWWREKFLPWVATQCDLRPFHSFETILTADEVEKIRDGTYKRAAAA